MRTLVLLNGNLHTSAWLRIPQLCGPWDMVICADGGGRHAIALGLAVDLLIGDGDSLSAAMKRQLHPNCIKQYPTDKDYTDGQLAVTEALHQGASHVVLAGALGDRIDHTLANIALLRHIAIAGASGVATDGKQSIYLLTDELNLPGQPGQLVSLIPNPPCAKGVSASGMRWPLEKSNLAWGDTRSISNEFIETTAHFSVEQGEVLVIINHIDSTLIPC